MINPNKPLEITNPVQGTFPVKYIGVYPEDNGVIVQFLPPFSKKIGMFDIATGLRKDGTSPSNQFWRLRNVAPKPVTHTHYLVWFKDHGECICSHTFNNAARQRQFAEDCSHLLKVEEISITV